MDRQPSYSEVIEMAKQQRAEQVGAVIGKHRFAALVVVAIPFVFAQILWTQSAPEAAAPTIENDIVSASIVPTQPQAHADRSVVLSSIGEAGGYPGR
jgi:hypothetical protein